MNNMSAPPPLPLPLHLSSSCYMFLDHRIDPIPNFCTGAVLMLLCAPTATPATSTPALYIVCVWCALCRGALPNPT